MPITFTRSRDVPNDVEVIGVPVYAGRVVPEGSPVELDERFMAARDFDGKPGQTLPLFADDGTTVVAIGMGDRGKVTADTVRKAAAAFVRTAGAARRGALAILDGLPETVTPQHAAQALAEGAVLGAYKFVTYKSEKKPTRLEALVVVGRGGAQVQTALDRGALIGEAVCMARDLVNEPAGTKTPRHIAEVAATIAEREGLQLTVWDEVEIANQGCGGLLGVSLGSEEPPRLIQLVHEPERPRATVALVGKGITFDSGGLSIKPADGMMQMKTDMSGAAAVLAAMSVARTVAPKTRVIGIMPTTENLPSGKAVKPGDVLKIRNGKTVEVLNTDAEGRLVLADGLSLAIEYGADAVLDIATLTGACVVALGRKVAGLMGNDDNIIEQVRAAGARAGESFWPLPLPDEYREHIDSEIADIKNIGAAGQAGALAAGLFLKEFVGDTPWAHLDIAGPARSESDDGYWIKGGTAFGARTLIEFISSYPPAAPKRTRVASSSG